MLEILRVIKMLKMWRRMYNFKKAVNIINVILDQLLNVNSFFEKN